MNLEELRRYKPQLCALARAHRADPDSIRVFGSVARGDQSESSDVDLLVTLLPEADLFDIAGLYVDMNELLQCKVDVVPDESIDPLIEPYIRQDIIPL